MSNFLFICPHCTTRFHAEEEWIGHSTECPVCRATVCIMKSKQIHIGKGFPKFSLFHFSCMLMIAVMISGIFYYAFSYKRPTGKLLANRDILVIAGLNNRKLPFAWGASPAACRKHYKKFTFSKRNAADVTVYEGLTVDGKIHRHGYSDDRSLYFIEMALADDELKNFLKECNDSNSNKERISIFFRESVFGTMPDGTVITGRMKNGSWEIMLSNPRFMEER